MPCGTQFGSDGKEIPWTFSGTDSSRDFLKRQPPLKKSNQCGLCLERGPMPRAHRGLVGLERTKFLSVLEDIFAKD